MRKTGFALAAAVIMFAQTATPASAFTNPLSKFTSGVKQKADRFYLQYLPGDKPGEMVLQQSAAAMEDVKTMQIQAEVAGKVDSTDGQEMGNGKMSFSGPMEVDQPTDPLSAKQDFTMQGEVSMGGTTLKASADFKQDGKDMYVKINVLPVLPFFDATKLKGQWLKMPLDESSTNKKVDELTAEEKEKLTQAGERLIKDSQVSKAKKEKKNGQDVYVVEISIPDSAIIQYMDTATEVTATEDQTAEVKTNSKKSLEEGLKAMDDIKASIWVDQKSFYMTHLDLPLVVDLAKLQATQSEGSDELATTPFGGSAQPGKMTGSMSMNFSDFNKPVTFEVPTDAKDFQQALMETMTVPGLDSSFVNPAVPNNAAKLNKSVKTKPVELQQLSPSEKEMLKQYGVEVEDIIP
jgi:hypothetical protein